MFWYITLMSLHWKVVNFSIPTSLVCARHPMDPNGLLTHSSANPDGPDKGKACSLFVEYMFGIQKAPAGAIPSISN